MQIKVSLTAVFILDLTSIFPLEATQILTKDSQDGICETLRYALKSMKKSSAHFTIRLNPEDHASTFEIYQSILYRNWKGNEENENIIFSFGN